MIDLTERKNYYEIKMFDGEVLHVLFPSQGILKQLLTLKNDMDNKSIDDLVIFDTIFALLAEIFSRNKENRVVSADDLEKGIDMATAVFILNDYFNTVADALKK